MPSYNVSKAPLEKMEIEVVYTDATRTVIAAVRLAAFGRVREDSGWLPPKDLLLQREWSELSITEKGYVEPVLRKAQKNLNLAAQLGDVDTLPPMP